MKLKELSVTERKELVKELKDSYIDKSLTRRSIVNNPTEAVEIALRALKDTDEFWKAINSDIDFHI